jgi:hypothetical protein
MNIYDAIQIGGQEIRIYRGPARASDPWHNAGVVIEQIRFGDNAYGFYTYTDMYSPNDENCVAIFRVKPKAFLN